MPNARQDQRGFVLVVVLLGLMLLGAIAVEFTFSVGIHVKSSRSMADLARTEAAADAGISLAILALADARARDVQNVQSSTAPCRFAPSVTLGIELQDEAGKIDLNFGDERLLKALFIGAGASNTEATGYVDRIIDFRDGDDLRRPFGAEQADYEAAGIGFGPKNGPFSSVDELEQVLGMDPVIVARVRDHLTVYSGHSGFDESVATTATLTKLVDELAKLGIASTREVATAMASLPGELRLRTSRNAFSVQTTAGSDDGSIFGRRAIVGFGREHPLGYRILAWSRVQSGIDDPNRIPTGLARECQ